MKYTPMIEQYLKIKKDYSDMFLFYRLGDFYELFFDDAIEASRLLEITLTGREAGVAERIPMCGVPFHSAANYIDTLVNNGHKVAICEQVSEPGQGKIVERKVIQVITPGTYMNYKNVDENNYLGCLYYSDKFYFAFCDIMTGDNRVVILNNKEELLDEILKNSIKEVLIIDNNEFILENVYTTRIERKNIEKNYKQTKLLNDQNLILVCNALLDYVETTQNMNVESMKDFEVYYKDRFVAMTNYSLKNLEITQNMANGAKKGSLLSVIDKTKTASGSRKIRKWLENPLLNKEEILQRQKIVGDFLENYFIRIDLQEALKEIYDLERIATKISYNIVTPKELYNLNQTLSKIPNIKQLLNSIKSINIENINKKILLLDELRNYLDNAIDDNAGQNIKEGNVIKEGFNKELDEYRNAQQNGNRMLLEIEQREREKTDIKNIKIGYNKIFGYYIEISKTNLKNLDITKLGYHRKQTLSNCERFVSDELKKVEEYIVSSNSKIEDLELRLFQEVKNEIKKYIFDIQKLANILSDLDVYISLATIAEEYNYVRPIFNENKIINIQDGRHPIVERMVDGATYISNDCTFSEDDNVLLITGPNMSGKSTYMRQLALIVILAQIGSYVPCRKANLPIFDKIFTRIGASDDLAGGKSTFMVEMIEARNALVESTENSLLIFDEIGRGTSTYDGIALAQAILEYITDTIGCKTIFSTHYHELTKLETLNKGIRNIHVSAKEDSGELIFLYKIKEGAIEKSYGIHVAKLADLPEKVIEKANEVLQQLESGVIKKETRIDLYSSKDNEQENTLKDNKIKISEKNKKYENIIFDLDNKNEKYDYISEVLENLDLFNTTPLTAMQILDDLKKKIKE